MSFRNVLDQTLAINPQSIRDCVGRIPQDVNPDCFDQVVAFLLDRWNKKPGNDNCLASVEDLLRGRREQILSVYQKLQGDAFGGQWSAAIQSAGLTTIDKVDNYVCNQADDIGAKTSQLLQNKAVFDAVWRIAIQQPLNNLGVQVIAEFYDNPTLRGRYQHYISQLRPEVGERVRGSIEEVFRQLPTPAGQNSYKGRYLCVGQVQSGKTSHYSGVISAAAEHGYKLIIVLAGRTRSLRNQTQSRLSKEHLHPKADWPNPRCYWFPMTQETGRDQAGDAGEFNGAPGDANPFRQLLAGSATGLLIVKKNYAVLEHIKVALEDLTAEQLQQMPTLIIDDEADEASLNGYRLPALGRNPEFNDCMNELTAAIDTVSSDVGCNRLPDEGQEAYFYRLVTEVAPQAIRCGLADDDDGAEGLVRRLVEASYLGAKYLLHQVYDGENGDAEKRTKLQEIISETETGDIVFMRTGINQRIIQIGGLLPKHCYLGYTATPSANILVNCEQETDLFPRHRIFHLEPGPDYRGLDYFYPPLNQLGPEPAPLREFLIQSVSEAEREEFLEGTLQSLPQGLQQSVAYFFIASAIYQIRNRNQAKDTTMLVHVASTQDLHTYARPLVMRAVDNFLNPQHRPANLLDEIWANIVICQPANALRQEYKYLEPNRQNVEKVAMQLAQDVIARQDVLVTIENSTTEAQDRLSYSDDERNPQSAGCHIVVGGNILARGLTLKRLLASYFIRRPGNQAALLQMARWFGYWSGYEDLVRVWTTADINDEFAGIAVKERDLAGQIDNLGPELGAPENVALIIAYRRGIKPTSPHLMQYAQQVKNQGLHIGGCTISTKAFRHRNHQSLENNIAAARLLLSNAVANDPARILHGNNPSRRLIRGVAGQLIQQFIQTYQFVTQDALGAFQALVTPIPRWNLGIVGVADVEDCLKFKWNQDLTLGKAGRLRLRSNANRDANRIAYITDLPRRGDTFFDLCGVVPDVEYVALLQAGRTARNDAARLRLANGVPPFIVLYALNENHCLPKGHTERSGLDDWDGTHPCIGWVMSFPSNVSVGGASVYANRTVLSS